VSRTIHTILRGVDRLSDATAALAVGLMAVMIGATLYEIVARYVFNAPTIWSNDVSTMLNGSVFLLAAGHTLRQDAHVRIDVLWQMLPARARHGVQAVFLLGVFAPVLGLGTYYAIVKAWRAWERGTVETASAWEPLIWPFLTALAVGLLGLLIQVVAEGVRNGLRLAGIADPPDPTRPSAS
jgi:TRAP-type mannitol/chloroaromatic compound transport system permease small subunit